jgi:hypothetical protein
MNDVYINDTHYNADTLIRVNENHYRYDTLTELAKNILTDMKTVQDRMNLISLDLSIMGLSKQLLINKLLEETVNLEEVPAPVENENN